MYTLGSGAIVWRCVKQVYMDYSTMEAKYVATCEVVKGGIWHHKFLNDLEVISNLDRLHIIYSDNSRMVTNSNNLEAIREVTIF